MVAVATLPFKFGKFHEQDHPFYEKKKKSSQLSPWGSVLSLEDFSRKASNEKKKTLKTGKYEQENRKTTFTFALGSSWFKIYLF